jgi:tRNA threonylcarbamoyladenosine biosynthesis protein TsaB
MRVLAIDTSTLAGGVALLDDDRLVAEYVLDVSLTHSERLLAAIDRTIADAGLGPRDLDVLAVAIGPGSFTGLRIAISTVKGLAYALGAPIAAVPTLDAMAAALPFAAHLVCPVLGARRNEVYAGLYRWDGGGMQRVWDEVALAPADLSERLEALEAPVIVIGDGAATITARSARLAPPPRRVPSPACVGALGLARARRGETVGAADLAPLYLRPSEAELRRRVAAVH